MTQDPFSVDMDATVLLKISGKLCTQAAPSWAKRPFFELHEETRLTHAYLRPPVVQGCTPASALRMYRKDGGLKFYAHTPCM